MLYQLNEGTLDIPDGLQERSVNMLMAPGGGPGLSLIVSRDRLESGESLDDFITRQLKDLSRQVSKFNEISRKHTLVGPKNRQCSAQQLEFNYKQNGQLVHQRQCVVLLSDQRRILILTGSSPTPFDEVLIKSWERTVASFKPCG